jgi:tripartite ATP-independent transporter DctM subunit
MLLFITIVFGGLLILGLPIAFVMGLTTLFSFFSLGNPSLYSLIPQRMYSGMANFVLIAIPFFIMTGVVMTKAGITRELVRFSNLMVGRLRGGLAHINIVSSVLFAGLSGSAASDAASIGSILIPAMTEEGYDLDFSASVTASSAAIGPIIPPSIIMIIYASLMDVSVAGLFLAGYAPGILIAVGLIILCYIMSKKRDYPIHSSKITRREFYEASRGAILPLILPIIIIAGILFGVFTPTEASVVAAAYALVLGFFVKKTIKLRDIPEILTITMKTSSLILFVIGTGVAFGWILSYEQIPQKLATVLIMFSGENYYITLFFILIVLFLAGMFMDTAVSIVVLGPLLLATALQLGVHPLHFAMIMCLSLTVGLITPPLGLVLFVVCGVTNLKLEELCKAMVPFILIEVIVIFIITYIPVITMTIPKIFGFYP